MNTNALTNMLLIITLVFFCQHCRSVNGAEADSDTGTDTSQDTATESSTETESDTSSESDSEHDTESESSSETENVLDLGGAFFATCFPEVDLKTITYTITESIGFETGVIIEWIDTAHSLSTFFYIERYETPFEQSSIEIDEVQANYFQCSACIWVAETIPNQNDVLRYFTPVADSGSAVFTELDPYFTFDTLFSGTFEVTLQEVVLDADSGTVVPIETGCSGTLIASWNDFIEAASGEK